MNTLACRVWTIKRTASVCLAILSPLICWFAHVDKKYDHVSLSLLGHTMQGRGVWVVKIYILM